MKQLIILLVFGLSTVWGNAQKATTPFISKIVIDPGHGGHDPGCLGKNSKEKDIALKLAIQVGRFIHMNNPNVEIRFTRTSDKFIPLHERIGMANKEKADLFISIHCNYSKNKEVKGTETFVMGLHSMDENLAVAQRENQVILLENDYEENYEGFDPKSPVGHIVLSSFQDAYLSHSLLLAEKIENELRTEGYSTSRGVKQAGFAVLRKATMPSLLIEAGFLSNLDEEEFLNSESGQMEIGHAIYRALSPYLDPRIGSSSKSIVTTIQAPAKKEEASKDKFAVQFAAMKTKIEYADDHPLLEIGEINILETDGLFKHQITNLRSPEEAERVKEKLRKMGYKGSFIVKL